MEEFIKGLQNLKSNLDVTPKTSKEYISDISSMVTQMEKMQSIIDSITKDGTFEMSDLLDLAETHPE